MLKLSMHTENPLSSVCAVLVRSAIRINSGQKLGRFDLSLSPITRKSCFFLLVSYFHVAFFLTASAAADAPAFDLTGPKIQINVTRGGKTLPISEVPNLQPGDRLWLYPEIPITQSVHYLLITAFLSGSTNPPPEHWFFRAETWNKQIRRDGIAITVPPEAEQVLIFLAPVTNGDFSTLRSAVRGKPEILGRLFHQVVGISVHDYVTRVQLLDFVV